MHISNQKLKEILQESGIVAAADFESAEKEAIRSGHSVIDILIGKEEVAEDYLVELLQNYLKLEQVDLKKTSIQKEALGLIPESFARSNNAVAFEYDPKKKVAKVAMVDPLDYETIEYLRARLGCWVMPYITTTASLKYAIRQYQKKISGDFGEVINENAKQLLAEKADGNLNKLSQAIPIVTILDTIIEHAAALNASDIHFEPMPNKVLIRNRIDGVLHEVLELDKSIEPILVARVKVLANLQIDEHRIPQDGRFRFQTEDGTTVDVRVNVLPVMHGEKVEMRLLRNSARPISLDELGLSAKATEIVKEQIKKPHGMILVTGPTGHGKTTTLYVILHMLNTPSVNITTIEDPIEYEVSGINQTQVNVKSGITFANGLRALLRQNPDIIMVGEIRDNETVEIAIHAALTGHLVLSSLHTNDAPSALPRLLDMQAPAFLLASTVNMVIAQRLVRRICTSCVISYEPPASVKTLIAKQFGSDKTTKSKVPKIFYKGKGCKVCGQSGFTGQVGIFEIMPVSERVRELVLRAAPVSEVRKQALAEGMVGMFEDGLEKVQKGVTTIEEVLRVVQE